MKRFWAVVISVLTSTAGLGLASGPASAAIPPSDGGACGTVCWAHYVEFRGNPMMEFYNHVDATPDLRRRFDMSNNGCSSPDWLDLNTDYWNDVFRRPCIIHDFGYRNFGPGEIHVNEAYLMPGQRNDWGADTDKEWIDQRFKQTMMWICAERDEPGGPDAGHPDNCENYADAYYSAVRWGGNDAWNNG